MAGDHRQGRRIGQHLGGGQFERGFPRFPHPPDPYGAIIGGARQSSILLADPGAGRTRQTVGGMAVEQVILAVQHAWAAIRGTQFTQDRGGVVALPVNGPVGLGHGRAPDGVAGAVGCWFAQGFQHRLHRRLGHLVAVQAGLGRRAQGKAAAGPDRAGIHLGFRLQHGQPPAFGAVHDGPIQGGGAAIALRTGMDHQTGMVFPHRLGDGALQERCDDDVGPGQFHRLDGHRVVDVKFQADSVAGGFQFHPQTLGQAVEGMGQ